MYKYLFSNPKGALLFVLAIMASTAMLVGSEDDEGLLVQAVDDVETQRDAFDEDVQELSGKGLFGQTVPDGSGRRIIVNGPGEEQNWDEFNLDNGNGAAPMADDALIDDASGYDPTPTYGEPTDAGIGGVEDEDYNGGEVIGVIEEPRLGGGPEFGPGVGPGAGPGGPPIPVSGPGNVIDQ